MGVSTDAKLVYGYVWEDELALLPFVDEESGEQDEWQEVIAARRGIKDPWTEFPEELDRLPYPEAERAGDEWTAAHSAEVAAWDDALKAITEEYGVGIDRHGSSEWTVPVVKIDAAGKTAARGYPQELTAADLAVDPEWDGRLRQFVTDLNIDTSEAKGPGWFLASWWG